MSLQELMDKRDQLDQAISDARAQEVSQVIDQLNGMIAQYDLRPSDLKFKKSGKVKGKNNKVAPKYRHPHTGETWTGRGREPAWIKGQDRALYVI